MSKVAATLLLILLAGCSRPDRPAERRNAGLAAPAGTAEDSPAFASRCRPEWRTLEAGLRHRSHCEGNSAAIHIVEVDPRLWTLDAARVTPTTAPRAARGSGAHFAINANFFDPDRKTLGAIVSAGESVQRPHPVSWQSIFYVSAEGDAAIVLPKEWDGVRDQARMAVQAGPRIVVEGRKNDVARATPSLRSGVCLAGARRVIFFVTSAFFDVHEMVDFAALDERKGGLGCRNAMLFDGGPSAQMHLEGAGISIEGDRVPAFVIAHPAGDPAPAE